VINKEEKLRHCLFGLHLNRMARSLMFCRKELPE
jgi:hypothetical protein